MAQAEQGTVALLDGPAEYASLEEMVDAAIAAAPHRSRSSLHRGVVHNARQIGDGRWVWRYDIGRHVEDADELWDDVDASTSPMTLVSGSASRFVADADAAEFARRKPGLRQFVVAGAGHSVQSDAPAELSSIVRGA